MGSLDLGLELHRKVIVQCLVVVPDDVAGVDPQPVFGVEQRVSAEPAAAAHQQGNDSLAPADHITNTDDLPRRSVGIEPVVPDDRRLQSDAPPQAPRRAPGRPIAIDPRRKPARARSSPVAPPAAEGILRGPRQTSPVRRFRRPMSKAASSNQPLPVVSRGRFGKRFSTVWIIGRDRCVSSRPA